VELTVDKDEKAEDVVKKAEIFVGSVLGESITPQQMQIALDVVERGKLQDELPF
jgi:hypothetical protein